MQLIFAEGHTLQSSMNLKSTLIEFGPNDLTNTIYGGPLII